MADIAIPGSKAAQTHLAGFREFLLKQNALALAIGVVIGGAMGRVVSGIVDDVIMPIVGVILPGGEWRNAQLVLSGSNAIKYGDLLGRILDFIIVAAVVYFVTKAILERNQPAPAAATTRTCPECLDPIPIAARRCRACGSQV
ncbi:MAG TPA: large conductance mechanosensitive channel protein MscL [Anaeromyxobacteraceae bacterium]|nr:large conductance mechanosensitive channel protein MscL [Anaeromyxobacteraceae bacterium]